MTDLQRPHAELRAAVMLAAKEICKLNFGRTDRTRPSRTLHLQEQILHFHS